MESILVKLNRLKREHEGLPIVAEGITFAMFKAMAHRRELPVGSEFVAALGIIFGPLGYKEAVSHEKESI